MTYEQTSIKKRLMLLLMGGLCAISTIMFFEARSSARTAVNEAYDRALLGSALAIMERILIVGDKIEVDIPYVAFEMLLTDHQDRVYYQIETQTGQFLSGYDDLPDRDQQQAKNNFDPVFYNGDYRGETVRIGLVQDYIASPSISTRVLVKVAETTHARDVLIAKMIKDALIRQFTLILVAALIMWLGVSWGLKPLVRLQQALNRRNPDDLHPIEHNVPIEVQSLVAAINNLMDRLSDSLGSMRRFTANAAHQLRTPLAAIQTQTELALKTHDPAELHKRFDHLKQSTLQSSRLVNQLLSLARITPNKAGLNSDRIDFYKLCHDVTINMVPVALEKEMDLGFEYDSTDAQITGQADLLQEALKNLIDNAIAYCPKGSVITVKLSSTDKQTCVEVTDNGPGIAPDLQSTIFERFNRGDRSDGNGCGLGLSIVKEITERHLGKVTLQSEKGKGTSFSLIFAKV